MKIYSIKSQDMSDYVFETRLDEFQVEDHQHLGDYNGRSYYCFNPDTVELGENDEKFEVTIYDKTDSEDLAHLNEVKKNLTLVKQAVYMAKVKVFRDHDIFDYLHGIANGNTDIQNQLNTINTEVNEIYTNFGF